MTGENTKKTTLFPIEKNRFAGETSKNNNPKEQICASEPRGLLWFSRCCWCAASHRQVSDTGPVLGGEAGKGRAACLTDEAGGLALLGSCRASEVSVALRSGLGQLPIPHHGAGDLLDGHWVDVAAAVGLILPSHALFNRVRPIAGCQWP